MTSREKGKPLPKFGEWDVNDPASADGFTVIFAKARDEKKAKTTTGSSAPSSMKEDVSPTRRPHTAKLMIVARKSGFAVSDVRFNAIEAIYET